MIAVTAAAPPVVVGIDESADALQAVRWAVPAAQRRGAPLHLVTVFPWAAPPPPRQVRRGAAYRDTLEQRAREHLAAATQLAESLAPDHPVESILRTGNPAAELLAAASGAQLVVVGRCGDAQLRPIAGSVAMAMATHAPCPVVVVRGLGGAGSANGADQRPVVVGIDGTEGSVAATAFAFEEASARRVPLIAVHAVGGRPADAPAHRALLDERLRPWTEKYPDVDVRSVITLERPVVRLLAEAENAQLLVVGSRGRGELASVVLGSVSSDAVHRAACPVAVVRA
ncbi:Nucleotide-binding universal stress protein, UspA family [Pseudonocardia thermophila]|uniref:Nucleotide-binding universal stress protein, UspA family n=1 Tax=Pseudonocardia thermophila TaxID=1848 RepID=A0A1M6V1S3_PSETH|nr:Nucleotide-binding universal stress protein, UspA family [Pseudonocardia thermophila]